MYVLDPQQQHKLIREMSMTRKDHDLTEAFYYHPGSEKMWKSFFPRANRNNRGTKILRIEPIPDSLEKWVEVCLAEGRLDDAHGLALELSALPEKWELLIEILEDNYRRYERKLLIAFLKKLQIENYQNLFDELNYTPEKIGLEKETLDRLARQSKRIRFKRFWFF